MFSRSSLICPCKPPQQWLKQAYRAGSKPSRSTTPPVLTSRTRFGMYEHVGAGHLSWDDRQSRIQVLIVSRVWAEDVLPESKWPERIFSSRSPPGPGSAITALDSQGSCTFFQRGTYIARRAPPREPGFRKLLRGGIHLPSATLNISKKVRRSRVRRWGSP